MLEVTSDYGWNWVADPWMPGAARERSYRERAGGFWRRGVAAQAAKNQTCPLIRQATASDSARRVSTRARCLLYSVEALRSAGGLVPSAACSAALAMFSAESSWPRSASSAAVARSGTEPMWVRPIRTSSQVPPEALTTAHTPTIAQSSERRLNFWWP